jgi:DNA-binding MarR family transcriptional regulator
MSEESPAPDLQDAAAVQALIRVSRILERAANELSLSDFRVLSAIHEGEERASRLAARLSIGRPSISATVDSLVRRGYLERAEVHDDQRADSLRVTSAGAAVRDRVERTLVGVIRRLSARSPHPETIVRALADLGAGLESEMRERTASVKPAGSRADAVRA